MATAQVSQNRVYLFRLQTLIIDGGTTVVRNIFDEKSANVPLNILLNNEKATINRLRASKTITRTQFDLLYPQSGQPPTIADFDLTLSICLLRNLTCCGLNKHFAWNAIPQAGDTSLEADICRLRMFRNEIAHISSTTSITQNTFTHKWLEIEQVLNRLNTCVQNPVQNLQQQFNAYKNSPLDEEAEKRIDGEIKKWRKFEKGLESEVQLVMKDVKEVKHEVGNVKEEVHDVAEKVDAVQEKIDELENEKRAQGGSKKAVRKAPNFIQRVFERIYMPWEIKKDEWESCLQSKNESQIKKLIQENCIPSSIHLDAAYRIFERSSELLGDIFALVSENIKKQSPYILRVYAAYDDRKNSESNYCFLVFTRQSEAGLKSLNVVYPIKIVRIEDCSEEDEDVVKGILKSHGPPVNISQVEINLNKVISDHSERLMKETKNITLITTSMYKSQNYQRGKPPCLINDPCVVILVMHKNWIPIGSKPLPRKINGISVDVREGIAIKFGGKRPSEKHDNVRIGCKIESSSLPGSGHSSWVYNEGTLGGFILGSNSTIYGFTCAHILFPDKTLKEMQRDEKIYIGKDLELNVMKQKEEVSSLDIIVKRLEERKVYQASCEMDEYLGTVEMALYTLGGTFDYTGVDFAVVKIDAERIPNTTEFPYVDDLGTFKRVILKTETEGASTERDFRFNSGKIIDEDLKCGEEVIKYGCKTLLTTGIFLGKRTFNNIDGETWYGQCEIVSNSSFAKESDSGSLVFRQKESDLEAACILLGGTRVRFAATYFPDILERTGLKDITFLKFDNPETKE